MFHSSECFGYNRATFMAITIGQLLGSYEITSLLGKGGMGEVYRARDTKLKRDVAIKILPDAFSNDPDRVSRFQREAEVLASLNHPNIAAIYDLTKFKESQVLILELVEGETLSDRISRGAIAIEEVLPMANEIAQALEAAHEKGIVHRDLKPANIKITTDGKVKLLDFGLAKTWKSNDVDLSHAPTQMTESTSGIVMGTPAYMSPEQAKGKETDRTTDVWSFGCVLYEMLTGHAVFEGETTAEIVVAVTKAEPDWTRLPTYTPLSLRRLMRRCLEKNSKQRLQHLGDARLEIRDALTGLTNEAGVAPGASRWRERFAWILGLLLVSLTAAAATMRLLRPVAGTELRLEIMTPATSDPISLAISPDAQQIAFAARTEDHSKLWLRSLSSVSARPLTGTDGATYPFWSSDGRSIAFFADAKLKRIEIDDGSIQVLADAPDPRGGSWGPDGSIIFSPSGNSGSLFRVFDTGGDVSQLTRLQAQQTNHRFPHFLPDGRHFLYYGLGGTPQSRGIFIGQVDGSEPRRLLDADSAGAYVSGHLLFVRQSALFAQNFDPVRLKLSGAAFQVAERVALSGRAQGGFALSTSRAGAFVFRPPSPAGLRQLTWVDRSGKEIGKAYDQPTSGVSPSISPDGRRVVLMRQEDANFDVWVLDLSRRVFTRLTSDLTIEGHPAWSPDGSRILFTSNQKGAFDLFEMPSAGGATKLVLATPESKDQMDWSPDARFVLYRNLADPKANSYDIWAVPLDGDRKPFPVVKTNYNERDGQFSPDGKWIAFQSNKSGRFQIYMQPFPGPGGELQLSTDGGAQARWRRDGKELFYIALDGRLMAVPIRLSANGQTVDASAPVPLFATHVDGAVQNTFPQQYAVSPDGQRFLMNNIIEEPTPITIVLNWKARP